MVAVSLKNYAIHQVDGIDNANGGKNSQGHGIPRRDRPDAPQTVEVVYAIAADEDQQQHDDDLDQKPQGRGEVQDIVHRAGIEEDTPTITSTIFNRTISGTVGITVQVSTESSEYQGDDDKQWATT